MLGKKKIGLALGGGAAKGFAHIGVLKVLEENGIRPDMISGTSVGSIIGALYALNPNAKELEALCERTNWKKLIDLALPSKGLIKGNKIESLLRKELNNLSFSDLKKPLFVTAVDLETGQEIIFNKGDLSSALRASIAIPGIFEPVENNGRILIDGSWVDPVPVEVLRKAGADIIIAVNLNAASEELPPKYETAVIDNDLKKAPNIIKTLLRSNQITQQEASLSQRKKYEADLMIEPNLKNYAPYDFKNFREGIKIGEMATRKKTGEINLKIKQGWIERVFGK